jgi:WD40 repeat protein
MRQQNTQPQTLAGAANEEDIWAIDAPYDSFLAQPETAKQHPRSWTWLCATVLIATIIGGLVWLDRQERADEEALCLYAQAQAGKPAPVIHALAYAPDGRTLAGGSADGTVRLWESTTGKQLRVFQGHSGNLCALAYSASGELLVAACADRPHQAGEAIVWDVATGEIKQSLEVEGKPVTALAFSQNGHVLATSHGSGRLTLWDTDTWRPLTKFENRQEVLSLSFSPDGTTLAAADLDGKLRLWNLPTGKAGAPHQCQEGVICSTVFSPDGRTLAMTGSDGTVRLWDVAAARVRHSFQIQPDYLPARAIAFAPDCRRLALGVGEWHRAAQLYLWDVSGRGEPTVLDGHKDMIFCIAFAPDGQTIATGDGDRTVRLWNAADGAEQLEIDVKAFDGATMSSP